jgi:hypothetical protein
MKKVINYFIYHNWRAKKNQATIHKESCRDCNSGVGKRAVKEVGKNGVWIGPFKSKQLAEDYVERVGMSVKHCSRCID